MTSANFSPDGFRIVTTSEDHTARVWDARFTSPFLPVPEWMRRRAQAIAGIYFDANGEMQSISQESGHARLIEPVPGDDPWAALARWLVQSLTERKLTPNSSLTRRQLAEHERDTGLLEGLQSALRFDTTVPLVHLLLAAHEKETIRAQFLRDYDLARMPEDAALWERAVRALKEQDDVERARRALQKLEKLAPGQAAAVRAELAL